MNEPAKKNIMSHSELFLMAVEKNMPKKKVEYQKFQIYHSF